MRLFDQLLEIIKCAKKRIYIAIVSYIIAHIRHRAWENRAKPYSVNP